MWFAKSKPKRKVFGFLCDPKLTEILRYQSKMLSLPIYPCAEHALALGCSQITLDLQSEDTTQSLMEHLTELHFLSRELDIDNAFDRDNAILMRKRQLTQWELDREAHRLVGIAARAGVTPKLLVDIFSMLIQKSSKGKGGIRHA